MKIFLSPAKRLNTDEIEKQWGKETQPRFERCGAINGDFKNQNAKTAERFDEHFRRHCPNELRAQSTLDCQT